MCPLAEAVGEMPLPLSQEIVGTDRSLGDNEGARRELGVVGGWQKTRAVASLEASCSERRGSQLEGDDRSLYVASSPVCASWAMTSEQQDYPSTQDLHAVLLSFAQLAIGCSNPTFTRQSHSPPPCPILPSANLSDRALQAPDHWEHRGRELSETRRTLFNPHHLSQSRHNQPTWCLQSQQSP